MSKIAKFLKALSLIARKPYLLNHVLNSEEAFKMAVIKSYNLSQGLPQIDLLTLFPDFTETLETFAFLDGGSTPLDIALLKSLARHFKVNDYLEIGTWRGESVANVASIAKNCVTVNLPDNTMRAMNLSEEYIQSHRFFSKELTNVNHVQAHSHTFDFGTLNTKFDMIFIDADHHYEAVKKDTETAFGLLKDDNSIIVWHDYARTPEIIRWDVMKGILDGCPPNKRGYVYHVSNTLCAVYTKKPFDTEFMKPYALPTKKFKVEVASAPLL